MMQGKYSTKVGMAFLIIFLFSGQGALPLQAAPLCPMEQSDAYQKYCRRPKTELSKLLFLIDRFKDSDIKVVYNGNHYDSEVATKYARQYIRDHYRSTQDAESFVKDHAHRSEPQGNVIYAEYPDGKIRPASEVLLEELKALAQKGSDK